MVINEYGGGKIVMMGECVQRCNTVMLGVLCDDEGAGNAAAVGRGCKGC